MGLVVQKYGGSSVADAESIRRVAARIVETKRAGHDVVVAVSAMGDTTDDLLDLAKQVSPVPPARELDMLLTAGERISMAVLAMAISDLGAVARSYTGSQAGVITDAAHGRARIIDVTPGRIQAALDEGAIPIVAGFQGVAHDTKDITTLGRGGSDVTAVALAAALKADVCEIYTDVTGVFSADPRVVPKARRLAKISFDEMMEMAATGGRVLMLRSVEFARRHGVPLHVRSSFTWEPGTWVVEEEVSMEEAVVSAVTDDTSEAKITVAHVPDRPGVAARLFRVLADHGINIDMIVQNTSDNGTTDISFTVEKGDNEAARVACESVRGELGIGEITADDGIGRVTLVGAGMKSNAGITAKMFEVLAERDINIEMISTSSIRISTIVRAERVEEAVRALHTAFGLDA